MNDHIVKASIVINASRAKVWKALTDPKLIKQYLFGTEAKSDWKVGSPIIYTGIWEGKQYEDKGTILEMIPEKLLKSNYWSSISGKADVPENYQNVTYELAEVGKGTRLDITQDNNPSEESKQHSQKNWSMVLEGMKKLLEQE